MNRQRLRQLFLDVDTHVAEQLLLALEKMQSSFSPELAEDASLSCHRLRGDARTVGFEVLAQLVGGVEDQLRVALKAGVVLEPTVIARLADAAREIIARMKGGEDGCSSPLSTEWLSWTSNQRPD